MMKTTIQQKKAFFDYVSEARAKKENWHQIVKGVNSEKILGRPYSTSGIRNLFTSLKKVNRIAASSKMSSFEIVEKVQQMRSTGLIWDEVAEKMGALGVTNGKTGRAYSGAGIQALYERLTGTKQCLRLVDKEPQMVKTDEPIDISTTAKLVHSNIGELIKLMTKLHEHLDAEKKKKQEHDDEVLKAMLVLEKLPSIKSMSDAQLEKLNTIAAMFNS